jgi:hypothetical protein
MRERIILTGIGCAGAVVGLAVGWAVGTIPSPIFWLLP